MNIQQINISNQLTINDIVQLGKDCGDGMQGYDHYNKNSIALSYAMDCMESEGDLAEFECHIDVLEQNGGEFDRACVIEAFLSL